MGVAENRELRNLELEKETLKAELSNFQRRYAEELLGMEGMMIQNNFGKQLKISKSYIWKLKLKNFFHKLMFVFKKKENQNDGTFNYFQP